MLRRKLIKKGSHGSDTGGKYGNAGNGLGRRCAATSR